MRELLAKVKSDLRQDDLESLSNQAIDWIQNEAGKEPENVKKLGVLQGSKRGTLLIFEPSESRNFGVFI
jgi:hypothetical protein